MMLVIRLTRVGKKNSPSYRVVVADKQRAVKRKFIEIIGNYNPTLSPKQLVIDKERALFWVEKGAQPSDTVNNLMVGLGILPKDKLIKKIYGKKLSKKAIKEGPAASLPGKASAGAGTPAPQKGPLSGASEGMRGKDTKPGMDGEQNEQQTETTVKENVAVKSENPKDSAEDKKNEGSEVVSESTEETKPEEKVSELDNK